MPTDLPTGTDDRDALDRALLERVALQRDVAAMESLYRRFEPRLRRFLRRLTTDDSLIEEACNDVMLTVWNKAHQFQARAKVSSWIFSIAYRVCLRMVKKQSRRDTILELAGDDLPEIAGSDDEELAVDENKALLAAVRALAPKQRLVVELCYFEGLSLAEISEIARCPVNTVKTRLHHARKNLRGVLEGFADGLAVNQEVTK